MKKASKQSDLEIFVESVFFGCGAVLAVCLLITAAFLIVHILIPPNVLSSLGF